ncbi:MAG: hypothetical protein K2G51_10900 [Lachnospiraceae bacterium]|nr:hypothetical protein [Lachnospiraceae bacterium]
MGNKKQKLRNNIWVIGVLSAILLSGCSKENVPKEDSSVDSGIESTVAEKDSMPEEYNSGAEKLAENSAPSEKVMEQTISEWKEMYASFYDYQDCSAVLSERTENDGTVDEIFTVDITYTSEQSDGDEPEHFIADMKASYPADNPEDITLWMDNSGGEMTALTLFKECGPG